MAYHSNDRDKKDGNCTASVTSINSVSKPVSLMDGEPTEYSPLLPNNAEQETVTDLDNRKRQWQSPSVVIFIVILSIVITSFGDQLSEAPRTRIYESIICYQYYEETDPTKINIGRELVPPGAVGGVDEMLCKVDAVQDKLAMLLGYQRLFDGIPTLLLSIPFGWAADKFGRWPFLFINLLANAMRFGWTNFVTWNWQAFGIRTIWLQSIFNVLGGGEAVAAAITFVVLSDLTREADRASVFFRIGAANLSAYLLMPPLAAWLMRTNPWIPSLIGLALSAIGPPCFLLVPETLDYRKSHSHPPTPTMVGPSSPSLRASDTGDTCDLETPPSLARRLRFALSFLLEDWRVPTLLMPFLGHILIVTGTPLLLQYVSKRYALTLAEGTLLVTLRNGVQAVTLVAILPYLSSTLMKTYGFCGQRKDLYLARASQLAAAIGWTAVGASPGLITVSISLVIASLAQGTMLLARSFMTSLIPAHHIARVYSLICMIETAGAMLGAPLLASLFNDGMALGGGWIGLPYYFLGLFSAVFAAIFFLVPMRDVQMSRVV